MIATSSSTLFPANHNSTVVFKRDSVTDIEGAILKPRGRNRCATRAMLGSTFASQGLWGISKQVLYAHLKDLIGRLLCTAIEVPFFDVGRMTNVNKREEGRSTSLGGIPLPL